ncbi:MAG: hypothetical protein ABSG26_25550 [Bryobacteraceae bacterium]|jgi:transcriptional regulator with XRE-family HTH domain
MNKTSVSAAAKFKDKFEEFVSDERRRRLYERESLAFDACELISHLMRTERTNKAELARRIGKAKSDITQLLSGSRNMTLHTFADITFALGYRVEFKARPLRSVRSEADAEAAKPTIYMYRFADHHRIKHPYQPETPQTPEKHAKSAGLVNAGLGA